MPLRAVLPVVVLLLMSAPANAEEPPPGPLMVHGLADHVLVGTWISDAGAWALVRTPDGRAHRVEVRTLLGSEYGVVTEIEAGGITVNQQFRDLADGSIIEKNEQLVLPGVRPPASERAAGTVDLSLAAADAAAVLRLLSAVLPSHNLAADGALEVEIDFHARGAEPSATVDALLAHAGLCVQVSESTSVVRAVAEGREGCVAALGTASTEAAAPDGAISLDLVQMPLTNLVGLLNSVQPEPEIVLAKKLGGERVVSLIVRDQSVDEVVATMAFVLDLAVKPKGKTRLLKPR